MKVIMFSKMLSFQFCFKSLITGFRIDCFLLKNGQNSHGLLKQVDAGSQVHPKVHGDPGDALPHVLLLLQHKHVVIEKLLQLKCFYTVEKYFFGNVLDTFSLTKLMQSCSKVLNSKISKPAISRTPMKLTFFMVGSIRVLLHMSTR